MFFSVMTTPAARTCNNASASTRDAGSFSIASASIKSCSVKLTPSITRLRRSLTVSRPPPTWDSKSASEYVSWLGTCMPTNDSTCASMIGPNVRKARSIAICPPAIHRGNCLAARSCPAPTTAAGESQAGIPSRVVFSFWRASTWSSNVAAVLRSVSSSVYLSSSAFPTM